VPESHRRPNHPPENQVRPPAVAGRFSPADPGELTALVDQLLAAAGAEAAAVRAPAPAYVVPHAALRYSGPTAAHVYARLQQPSHGTVVILGPAHYVPIHGCAVPAAAAWRTPLGDVAVDRDLVRALVRDGHVNVDDHPFAPEHSLEVQLPFLQRVRPGGVRVLPVLVGQSTVDDLVVTLSAVGEAAGPDTILVCSTDLSHYQAEPVAEAQDARTTQAVLDLAPERIGPRDACGAFALRGLVGWAKHQRLRPRLLDRCTSAKTGGDPGRVVGYAAFSFR
jgi:AmmeMemoRadiSam system protein B